MKLKTKQIGPYFIGIEIENDYIVGLEINETLHQDDAFSPLHLEAFKQLEEYFKRQRTTFELPIKFVGTPFQKKVWQQLLNIPYGQVINYEQLAQRIEQPTAFRAVGNANGKNPLPIIVPCHRVINKNGHIGGYTGGVEVKETLLKLEGVL